jgi:DNA replication and repair protein RecF
MYIEKVELSDFRNYKELSLDIDRYTNIIYGDNAQGKTNILEALFLAATTKSHRQSKDRDIIRFGCNEAHIRIYINKRDIKHRIDLHLRKNRTKAIAIDGVPIRKAAELLGLLNIVLFSPEDLSIIKNGPSERRRFIDIELCQLDPYYLSSLSAYNKTINQRNRLLRDMYNAPELADMLDIYDEQLVRSGSVIIDKRKEFCSELEDIIKIIHGRISGDREKCTIEYIYDVKKEELSDTLKKNRLRDIKQKTTTTGPHRDDILFNLNGLDVRKYGSQGQQRSTALSLKLSEIEIIRKIKKEDPVLLLDDVLSELDTKRQTFLLESIKNIQTIITCTGLDDFVNKRFEINRIYRVINGEIDNAE